MANRRDIVRQPMSSKVLDLCLKSLHSKNHLITSNVFAVIQQMYTLLFEQYASESRLREDIEKTEVHEVCYEQLERLIELAGEKKRSLKFKGLALDCITMVLAAAGSALSSSARIQSLFENSYIPSFCNYLGSSKASSSNSFTHASRIVRSATQLMLVAGNSYALLQPLISMSNSQKPWQRYLALEAFSSLLKKYEQIQKLHKIFNKATNMRVLFLIINSCWEIWCTQ
eukprot:TRINITY_DN22443_c0_g1_i1.p1 TRINITY_DN22443_c0_g1~~TRINITY_DN22443_c0_g1_i1.p1  ORF type:complete len:257 (+),score=64.05 TRINITY_DN22443_c0_g1_i1:90-773(+)